MGKSTRAILALRKLGIEHRTHEYPYVERGGTAASASALGVDEHCVIKTLIFEDQNRQPLIVLMHGDHEVSTKALARQIGARSVKPCTPEVANRHSGYQVGGTSPFGTKKSMPIYMERTISELDQLYINGGSRGFLVELSAVDLIRALSPQAVDVARS